MAIELKDTVSLMQAMERIKAPATTLVDTFFPNIPTPAVTSKIMVEYRKGNRRLAPFVVEGAKGLNVSREGSNVNIYEPPMVAPRRTVSPEDIEQRGFGESIYSAKTAAQRATEIQARDLAELQAMILNRKNQMAAEVLKTGAYTINGYADDGVTAKVATISFGTVQIITPTTEWDQAGATIYADIKNASEMVQENAGMVPTVALVGKNIGAYLLGNTEIMKWLSVPNNNNLALMSIQPRITSPQVMRIGFIASLNLEVFAYMETYLDDSGNVVPFLGDNDVIVGVPGRGRQLHGAVNLINDEETGFETYSGLYVPKYAASKNSNTMSLTVYSRFLLAPEFMDDWVYIKAKA
ncbi:major capsid protein [Selenomonas ruminantium]|uniref:major capsid protein n=1 Tax=Selenomonas ruminantium TaxID=971 RepID=UPI000419D785|nr:major capsid protein [Selenomonas ruminantium]